MDIAILTPDGQTRLDVIVADLATAQALYPGMLCVERGTGADLTATELAVTHPAATIAPISARQIRLALNQLGMRDAVEAVVAAAGRDVRDYWEYSTEIHRDHPLIVQMLPALGITPEQADAVWRLGATM